MLLSYRDGLPFVEQIEDVSRALMVNLEDWPERLDLPFAFVRLILRFFHLDRQFLKKRSINLSLDDLKLTNEH